MAELNKTAARASRNGQKIPHPHPVVVSESYCAGCPAAGAIATVLGSGDSQGASAVFAS